MSSETTHGNAISVPTEQEDRSFLISITDDQAEFIEENCISLSRCARAKLDELMSEVTICPQCGAELKNEHGAAVHWTHMNHDGPHPFDVTFSKEHRQNISEALST